MPETDYRLILWRNTIQLFHRYNRPSFIGPFKETGYKYQIEGYFLAKDTGEELRPDIVASNEDVSWGLIELTAQEESKESKLDSYKKIDPRDLSRYKLPVHTSEPDTMSSRLVTFDDGSHCQIYVNGILEVKKPEFIRNIQLRDALLKSQGVDLTKLPQIPITLLPEMRSQEEIRRGLIDIVMQLFDPHCNGKTLTEITNEGLERLHDKIGPHERHSLQQRVGVAMNDLITNFLIGYIEIKNNIYIATDKFKQHSKTMGYIALKLNEWAGNIMVKPLEEFLPEGALTNNSKK